MQQTAVFCKELSPTRKEHLMNRARAELDKLKRVTKTKKLIAEMRSTSPEQSKTKVDVLSLVEIKKNEIRVSEENYLETSKVKQKRKKHKSKSKDYRYKSNEVNNTLSLGLRVNIEVANGANENDVVLNPKHTESTLIKDGSQDSALRLKEKTEKTKCDGNKKQKGVRQSVDESEELACVPKHKKKKSRRESSPLNEIICPEKVESESKRQKGVGHYDSSTFQLEKRKRKTLKVLADSLLEMETEHKSKKKKKKNKHKDTQSEDEEESFNDTNKKMKKNKTIEHTESLEYSHNEVHCNESVVVRKDKKHKNNRDAENVKTLDSSHMYKRKKKKHKDVKESDLSFTESSYGELKDNTEETNFTETSESPNKRKRTKHKTHAFELEVQDAEVCSNKKKKEEVPEISNECIMDKQRKKRHRKDSEEFSEQIELPKKRKTRKSTEEEVMHSVSELVESQCVKEDEFTGLRSKSTKHKKKHRKECKEVENNDFSSENIQEINTNESTLFLGKKAKRKRRLLNENDEMQNVLLEDEHQLENVPDADSVVIDKSSEQSRRHGEESVVAASDCENGQRKKKKTKKSKSKEQERAEINNEVALSETVVENTSQNVSPLRICLASKANATFGRSPMERLLYGDPDSVVTKTCTHCSQCSHDVTPKPYPSVNTVVSTVNVKEEMSSTPKLQDDVKKPCVLENIVDTIVIKKEPGLETENSNSEVIEPINFIDINNVHIKQEPGLETETPPDQVVDPIQFKLPNHELQKEIKKEPGTETQNNLSVVVSSMDMLASEAKQQLPLLKKELVEEPNLSTDGASALEGISNTPTEDTYLNSVISAEDSASGFFRHAPTSSNNNVASECQSVCAEKTSGRAVSPSTTAYISKVESANNVPDNAEYEATPQQRNLSTHELTSKQASFNSERRQSALKEEWVYELHMVDVPYKVHFSRIAHYFQVPISNVREYQGYGRRRGYKHVVVLLRHYSTCLRMSQKRRLFGSRYSYAWSFKKYIPQDS